jgi:hypothetical protein
VAEIVDDANDVQRRRRSAIPDGNRCADGVAAKKVPRERIGDHGDG